MTRTSGIVWAIVGFVAAVDVAAVVLGVLDRAVQSLVATAMFATVSVGFAALGGLIVWRHRAHSIGWLFVAVAVFFSVCHNLAQNYAVYVLVVQDGAWPGGKAAFWLSSSALDSVYAASMILLLLLFPDGRPLTPRWRPAVAAAVLGAFLGLASGFTDFTGEPPLRHVHNPLALGGSWATAVDAARAVGVPLSVVSFVAGVAAMVLRFRRSTGIEREQVKLVAAGVVVVTAVFAATGVLAVAGAGDYAALPFVLSLVLFPTLMGVSILRYRLYDIDLVIRKTMVYACLVAVLGVVYLSAISILGTLSRSATGQRGGAAVTVSTLVVALVFQPLRRRIQHAIDLRFARRTADAEAAVQAFSGRLREQVDLDALCGELIGVVDQTFQPRHATLWLRPSGNDG